MVFMAAVASCNAAAEQDRTITKVVKLLQSMLKKSVAEGDEERKIFAKFQCYCDQNEADKNDSIKKLTEQIALLESNIAETQGDTGGLSSDCADLKTKMRARRRRLSGENNRNLSRLRKMTSRLQLH